MFGETSDGAQEHKVGAGNKRQLPQATCSSNMHRALVEVKSRTSCAVTSYHKVVQVQSPGN